MIIFLVFESCGRLEGNVVLSSVSWAGAGYRAVAGLAPPYVRCLGKSSIGQVAIGEAAPLNWEPAKGWPYIQRIANSQIDQ